MGSSASSRRDWSSNRSSSDARRDFITATAAYIRQEQARGRIGDLPDVDETARALIWLDERYLSESLGRTPQADPKVVVDVLHNIWITTLYEGGGFARRGVE